MKNYSYRLFFTNEFERVKAINVLLANGIEAEHNTCYNASIIDEIVNQLIDRKEKISDELVMKCFNNLDLDETWNNFEQTIEENVDIVLDRLLEDL